MNVTRPIKLGQLAGIQIDLNPVSLLYIPLGIVLMELGSVTDESNNGRSLVNWVLACIALLFMGISIGLHELGHWLTAVFYKLPIRQTTLYPFGGVRQMGSVPVPLRSFLFMLLAGPIASLLQAGFWLAIWLWWDVIIFLWLTQFNLLLALLNLLPASRLDGGAFLAALPPRLLPQKMSSLIGFLTSAYLSSGILLTGGLIILFGLFTPVNMWLSGGVLLILTGLLLSSSDEQIILPLTKTQEQQLRQTAVAQLVDPVSCSALVLDSMTGLAYPTRISPVTTLQPWIVRPDSSVWVVLHQLEAARAATLLLADNHRIVGSISRTQIFQYLATPEASLRPSSFNTFLLFKAKTAVVRPASLKQPMEEKIWN